MSSSPTVSVVIPVYNGRETIGETLASLASQTAAPTEILVIDDGSTDGTADFVRQHAGPIRVISKKNEGLAATRNCGVENAIGDWVAFIDADDLWKPTKLERQLAAMKSHPGHVCYFTWFEYFGGTTDTPPPPTTEPFAVYREPFVAFDFLILPSSILFRRDVKTRFFVEGPPSDDLMFFTDLVDEGSLCLVNEPLVEYRKHAGAMTQQPGVATRGWSALFRWANAKTPERCAETSRQLWQRLIESMAIAKYRRDWPRYWELRQFADERWPAGEPRPPELGERILPPLVYQVKDAFDRVFGEGSLLSSPHQPASPIKRARRIPNETG